MGKADRLLLQESHFEFGKNWTSYAAGVSDAEIAEAVAGMTRLIGAELPGRRMLDIGCGSGIHALAALRLGAASVTAIDIDPDSVGAAKGMLSRHAAGLANWSVDVQSVFDLAPDTFGRFDVVYSWGVLHHTGDMFGALDKAAALVAPGGCFVVALYRRTWLCPVWKLEKRWYTQASARAQNIMQSLFTGLFGVGLAVHGGSLRDHIAGYRQSRGMDYWHDLHDWLGGYPYESISPTQMDRFMVQRGFEKVREFIAPKKSIGFFGSGCDEFVFRRVQDS